MMIYCPECGKSISSESEKCVYCGTYNAFNGTPIDNVHVNLLNANSGDVILSADSDSMTNK